MSTEHSGLELEDSAPAMNNTESVPIWRQDQHYETNTLAARPRSDELVYDHSAYQDEQDQHYETNTLAARRSRTFHSAESALRDAAEPGNTNFGGQPVAHPRAYPGQPVGEAPTNVGTRWVGMALPPKTRSWSDRLRRMVTDIDE